MRGKLITNGILSLTGLFGLILMVAGIIHAGNEVYEVHSMGYGYDHVYYTHGTLRDIWFGVVGAIIYGLSAFTAFIMGIITLATMNGDNRGTVIASGILGILGGMFGINAIVSFIGAKNTY